MLGFVFAGISAPTLLAIFGGVGGAVLVVEMVPNDDRVSPSFPAMFAFVMLASTPGGDAWTARELQEMGRAAGFADSMVQPLPPSPQTMIVFR